MSSADLNLTGTTTHRLKVVSRLGLIALSFAALSACERPPVETLQGGYRGLGMETVINPRTDAKKAALNKVPELIPAATFRKSTARCA